MLKMAQVTVAVLASFASVSHASEIRGGWEMNFRDGGTCITQTIGFDSADNGGPQFAAFSQNLAAFEPNVRLFKGLFAGHEFRPFSQIQELNFVGMNGVNAGVSDYALTFKSGDRFKFDDGSNYEIIGCSGDPMKEENSCVRLNYLRLQCMNPDEGTTRPYYIRWGSVPLRVGPPRGYQEAKLKQLRAMSEDALASVIERFEKAKAARPALLAAQQAAATEQARQREAAYKVAMEKEAANRTRILRGASPGTAMFCTSNSNYVLAVGENITQTSYKCDLLGDSYVNLRDILANGWSVVTENRTMVPTYSGQGVVVSLQLRKKK